MASARKEVVADIGTHGLKIGNVKVGHIRIEEMMMGISRFEQLQFVAQLSVAACDKYVHVIVYYI